MATERLDNAIHERKRRLAVKRINEALGELLEDGRPQEATARPELNFKLCLRIDEAALALGISVRGMYRLIETGEIPFLRIGQKRVVRIADLEDYAEKNISRAVADA